MDTYIASFNRSRIIDFGASSHVIGIKNKFDSLELSYKYSHIHIADGSPSSMVVM